MSPFPLLFVVGEGEELGCSESSNCLKRAPSLSSQAQSPPPVPRGGECLLRSPFKFSRFLDFTDYATWRPPCSRICVPVLEVRSSTPHVQLFTSSGSETRAGVHVRVLPMPPDHPCHRCIRPLSPGRLQNRVLQHTWIAGSGAPYRQRRRSALAEVCGGAAQPCSRRPQQPDATEERRGSGNQRVDFLLLSLPTPVCRRTRPSCRRRLGA